MKRTLLVVITLGLVVSASACVNRIAPFSPHRTNTDFHHTAQTNPQCIECHTVASIAKGHQAADDCLRCHRILQGD